MPRLVRRHIAKTITWRIVGTIDTIIIGWLISGNPVIGLSIGGVEVVTKMLLYFLHERIWLKLGHYNSNKALFFEYLHVAKTISWRIIGTIDTTLIAWVIAGDPMIGLKIGSIEIVTKMILYYLHEKIWSRFYSDIK